MVGTVTTRPPEWTGKVGASYNLGKRMMKYSYVTQNQNKFPLEHDTPFVKGKGNHQCKYPKPKFPFQRATPLVKLQDKQQRTC
jgi:hypothetical protein